jgi:hypothetical protein
MCLRASVPASVWNLKSTLRKLKAGGHECWLLLLDLVKAFDRCDRALLWAVMERLGVPPTVLLVLKALHEEVVVKFDVDQGAPKKKKRRTYLPTYLF